MINLTIIRLILQHPFHLHSYMVSGVTAFFLCTDVNIVEYVTQKKQEINKCGVKLKISTQCIKSAKRAELRRKSHLKGGKNKAGSDPVT